MRTGRLEMEMAIADERKSNKIYSMYSAVLADKIY
jgi:hypothetical protein